MTASVSAPAASERPPERVGGRPSLFTPANRLALLAALERGHKRKSACGLIGIAYDTFNKWLQRGKDEPDSEFATFLQEVQDAEQIGIAKLVDKWIDQTENDNRALRSLLAIKDPDEYSEPRQLRVQHSGTVAHVHVAVAQLDLGAVAGLLGLSEEETIDAEAHIVE